MTPRPSWSQGFPGVCARYAVAAGSALAFRAAFTTVPWGGVVALVVLGMLLAIAFSALSAYSELVAAERFEDLLDEKDVALASWEKHVDILQGRFASLIKLSFDATRHARLSERAAVEAEHRASQSYRNAVTWRFEAERWQGIAVENAEAGVRVAHVLTTQVAQLGGEAEVQRAEQLLAVSEKKN